MEAPTSSSSLDWYFVLGVRPDATQGEIEMAYLRAVSALPERGLARWLAAFWLGRSADTLRQAHETLSDPVSRAAFDAWRRRCALNFSPPF